MKKHLPILLLTLAFTLHIHAQVTANAGPDVSYCKSGIKTIGGNPTASGSYPPFSYYWEPYKGISSTSSSNPTLEGQPDSLYYLTVVDSKGNQAKDTVKVTLVAPPPVLTHNLTTDTICAGDVVIFTASPFAYDSFLFYVGGSIQQASSQLNTWTTTTLGDQNIIHVDVFKNGCRNYYWSNTITMTVKPTPQMTITASKLKPCAEDTVTLIATPQQARSENYTFYVNSVEVQDGRDSIYRFNPPYTNDTVTVVGWLNGCTSRTAYPVILQTGTESIAINGDSTICEGEPASFRATTTCAGTDAHLQWLLNNKAVWIDSSYYRIDTPSTGDVIYCLIVYDRGPALPPTTSNIITLNVIPYLPVPTIIRSGDTLTSSIPNINWYRNGTFYKSGTKIIITEPGTYTVRAPGICTNLSEPFIVEPTGIEEISPASVQLYPNPATQQLGISVDGFQPTGIIIYDINSRRIVEQKFERLLNVEALPAGIYFLEIKGNQYTVRKKFVKQ